jgi:hypothetical protein
MVLAEMTGGSNEARSYELRATSKLKPTRGSKLEAQSRLL